MPGIKNFILTGKFGCGKTTLIKETTLPWRNRTAGFYTEEICEGPDRAGYVLKTFSGEEGVLAARGLKSPVKMNKYGVNLKVLEDLGVAAMEKGLEGDGLLVVDEIGSMEFLSTVFHRAIVKCLQSSRPMLATVRFNAQPFTNEIRKMAETRLVLLTRENYPKVKEDVRRWLDEKLSRETPNV